MNIADVVSALASAGCTPQQIADVVKTLQGSQSSAAIRQARYRSRGGGAIPYDLRMQVFERDGFACLECGSEEDLSCDHAVPVSKGGETTLENLQTLCRPCNSRKKDRIRKYEKRADKSGQNRNSAVSPKRSGQVPGLLDCQGREGCGEKGLARDMAELDQIGGRALATRIATSKANHVLCPDQPHIRNGNRK